MCTSALVRRVCTFSYFVTLTSKQPPPPPNPLTQSTIFMRRLCIMLCGALLHYILLSKPTCPEGPCITASGCSTADDDHTLAQLLLSGRPHTNTFSPQLFFFILHSRLYTYTDKKLPWSESGTIKSPPPPPTILQNLSHSHTVSVILAAGFAE